jgi:geranylgeranyl diphosphate synthase, type II
MWGALLANEKSIGTPATIRVMDEFARMVNETTEGQHMELGWVSAKRWDLAEDDYYTMCTKKTSWYTVAGPCRLGAIVAGAREGVLGPLKDFGLKLGVAFQIQDDALNLVGDEKKYGKAKSDDILEGKRTLILLRLLSQAGPDERGKLVAIMSKPRDQKTPADVAYVLSQMKDSGAIAYARKRALELMTEAVSTLRGIEWGGDPEAVGLLQSFARFAVEREW